MKNRLLFLICFLSVSLSSAQWNIAKSSKVSGTIFFSSSDALQTDVEVWASPINGFSCFYLQAGTKYWDTKGHKKPLKPDKVDQLFVNYQGREYRLKSIPYKVFKPEEVFFQKNILLEVLAVGKINLYIYHTFTEYDPHGGSGNGSFDQEYYIQKNDGEITKVNLNRIGPSVYMYFEDCKDLYDSKGDLNVIGDLIGLIDDYNSQCK